MKGHFSCHAESEERAFCHIRLRNKKAAMFLSIREGTCSIFYQKKGVSHFQKKAMTPAVCKAGFLLFTWMV